MCCIWLILYLTQINPILVLLDSESEAAIATNLIRQQESVTAIMSVLLSSTVIFPLVFRV
jgi:hypothetical protein